MAATVDEVKPASDVLAPPRDTGAGRARRRKDSLMALAFLRDRKSVV